MHQAGIPRLMFFVRVSNEPSEDTCIFIWQPWPVAAAFS